MCFGEIELQKVLLEQALDIEKLPADMLCSCVKKSGEWTLQKGCNQKLCVSQMTWCKEIAFEIMVQPSQSTDMLSSIGEGRRKRKVNASNSGKKAISKSECVREST